MVVKKLVSKKLVAKKLVCGKGTIKRDSFTRLSPYGKIVKIPPTCIRATSATGLKRKAIVARIMAVKARLQKMAKARFGKPPVCKPTEILREGYHRKSVVRRSYTKKTPKSRTVRIASRKVKGAWVAPKCIKSRGRVVGVKGKKVIGYLFKGTLGKFGYAKVQALTVAQRRKALHRAMKHLPALTVYRKLIAIATLQKHTNPKAHKIFRTDAEWVKRQPAYRARPTGK